MRSLIEKLERVAADPNVNPVAREGARRDADGYRQALAVKGHAVPHPTDKDLAMNALGALLASTMPSDLDEDFCERGQ